MTLWKGELLVIVLVAVLLIVGSYFAGHKQAAAGPVLPDQRVVSQASPDGISIPTAPAR